MCFNYTLFDIFVDGRAGSAENKNSKVKLSKRKLKYKKSKKTTSSPFNFSAMLNVSYCLLSLHYMCGVFIDNQVVLIVNDVEYVCIHSYEYVLLLRLKDV